MSGAGQLVCELCSELAVVFLLHWNDQPALCMCFPCAVANGWPWLISEQPKRKGATR